MFFIGVIVGIAIAVTFPKRILALHDRLKPLFNQKLDNSFKEKNFVQENTYI